MSQLLGCLEHLQSGALSMVTSVWGTENNHRGISQRSRADDGACTLVFGLKILVQQLPGEPVCTYLLTPWSIALHEKLTGSQPVKKSPTFYGT